MKLGISHSFPAQAQRGSGGADLAKEALDDAERALVASGVAADVVAGLARGRRRAASAPAPADGARAAARGPVADVHDVGLPLGHAGDLQVASARHAAAFVEPQARQAGQEGTAQSGSP